MHHLIYGSRATAPLTDDDLLALLLQARRYNQRHGISGALVYSDGQFMQLLEGEPAVLAELYERIRHDPRHGQLVKYADKSIGQRSFAGWSMAFRPVSEAQFANLVSYLPAAEFAGTAPGLSAADDLLLRLMQTLVGPLPA